VELWKECPACGVVVRGSAGQAAPHHCPKLLLRLLCKLTKNNVHGEVDGADGLISDKAEHDDQLSYQNNIYLPFSFLAWLSCLR